MIFKNGGIHINKLNNLSSNKCPLNFFLFYIVGKLYEKFIIFLSLRSLKNVINRVIINLYISIISILLMSIFKCCSKYLSYFNCFLVLNLLMVVKTVFSLWMVSKKEFIIGLQFNISFIINKPCFD